MSKKKKAGQPPSDPDSVELLKALCNAGIDKRRSPENMQALDDLIRRAVHRVEWYRDAINLDTDHLANAIRVRKKHEREIGKLEAEIRQYNEMLMPLLLALFTCRDSLNETLDEIAVPD